MRCSKCGTDNPLSMKFCGDCGAPLANLCPKCGFDNPPRFKFCGECAAPLAAGSGAAPPAPAPGATTAGISVTAEPATGDVPEGERKTVTALFADIKGSTELMADLDPEEARAIVDPALALMDLARENLERALELVRTEAPRGPLGQAAVAALPLVQVLLGYSTTALAKARDFLAAARRLSDPYFTAYALFSDAALHALFGDSRATLARSEELLSIATEHGFALFHPLASFFRGWALAGLRRVEEGITEMRASISLLPRGGATTPYFCPLAEAYGKNGQPEEGLAAVAEGLARVEVSGERTFEAELHRVKGELLLMGGTPDQVEAERSFRIAIDIARCQQARFWELRATTSLARLLSKQDNRDEARKMLAEIYGWFTEGFEFADLKDAKALLEELA